jgi:hypothetical protein
MPSASTTFRDRATISTSSVAQALEGMAERSMHLDHHR